MAWVVPKWSEDPDVLFVVHCLDHDDAFEDRLALYESHKAYLASAKVRTVISGPLLGPDHETMIGSLFVLDASDRETVEAFNAADPFSRAGVWKTVKIHPFNKRVDNRATLQGDTSTEGEVG
jgi:uncharacterized protein YciI